jgi:hypothetical protein
MSIVTGIVNDNDVTGHAIKFVNRVSTGVQV